MSADTKLAIFMIVYVVFVLIFMCIFFNDGKSSKKKAKKNDQKPQRVQKAEPVVMEVDPKVTALKSAAGKSLRLNLMAEQAFAEMVAAAGMRRDDAQQSSGSRDDWYRRAEWTVDEDKNWR